MSTETPESQPVSEAAAETTPEATGDSTVSTGYSATDPGYETVEPVENELEALKAENTKTEPSDETPSDDASETAVEGEDADDDGEAEEVAETPSDDAAESVDDISDELLDRAIAVGYELDDIRDFKDAKSFEREIARVERLQDRLKSKTAPASESDAPEDTTDPEPDWEQMVEDGHDPDIIELQKRNWQRAAAAEAQVRELRQAEQARIAAAEAERFDNTLNSLGDEYEPLLGKGNWSELSKAKPEAARNRQKVFTKMQVLRQGYQLAGEPVPSESELINEAVQASFYRQAQEIARNSIKRQIKKAGSQALSRPRSGGPQELTGPQLALQKEQEFWKAHS
jgi:hypothetical protein